MNNEEKELYHHGILGMKWGVRRYQNPDGSLKKKNRQSDDYKNAKEISKKKIKEMSNNELAKLNQRKQLEAQYKQLNRSNFKKGVAFVAGATAIMSTAISFYNTSNTMINIGKKVGSQIADKISDVVFNDVVKHWH